MTQKETETEKITITIQLPKKIVSFLRDFCKLADITLEELCREELEQVIKYFYQGGFYENWSTEAFERRDVAEYFKVSA